MTSTQSFPSELLPSSAQASDVDKGLVTELHAAHGAALFDFARHLGLSDDQAAEVVQEALLRLWRELGRGSPIERPLAWTYRTTYRLSMQQHRWRRRLALLLPRLAPGHAAYAGPESSDRVAVWTEVDRLPPRQRQVLYLRFAADQAFDEIAGTLGISAGAARAHASRGLATLRSTLQVEDIT